MEKSEVKVKTSNRWGQGARIHDPELGRALLLDAALYCLATRGIQATTMKDIAETARVSRRTVHRYFPGKQEMLHEVAAHSENKAFQAMQASASPFSDNFVTYFEEAVIAGVRYFQNIESARKVWGDPHHYSDNESLTNRWKRLLRPAYQIYLTKNSNTRITGMLDKFASLAVLLLTGHCQLRSNEESVRRSFHYMRIRLPQTS